MQWSMFSLNRTFALIMLCRLNDGVFPYENTLCRRSMKVSADAPMHSTIRSNGDGTLLLYRRLQASRDDLSCVSAWLPCLS